MARNEASSGLLPHLTDNHLADRARLGEMVAFDELLRRHAGTVVAFATVVGCDAGAAKRSGVRAFTDLFDEINAGDYSMEDPYLPGLLHSTRDLARLEALEQGGANVAMDRFLPEPARSIRWLSTVAGFDTAALAIAMGVDEPEVGGLLAWTDGLLGSRASAIDGVLAGVATAVPITFAADARQAWKAWAATAPSAVLDDGALAGSAHRWEPIVTRILRGAAVVVLVAGAAGLVFGSDPASPGRGQPASASQAAPRSAGNSGSSAQGTKAGTRVLSMRIDRFPDLKALDGLGEPIDISAAANAGSAPAATTDNWGAMGGLSAMTEGTTDAGLSQAMANAVPGVTVAPGPPVPKPRPRPIQGGAPSADQAAATATLPAPTSSVPPARPTPTTPATGSPGSGSGSSGGSTSPSTNPAATTTPPVTTPPVTTPPVTTPPVTNPPATTTPPVTTPPVTTPPVTTPPVTTPAVTTTPATTAPPVTPFPPITVPPVTLPPVTVPPDTVPPVVPKTTGGGSGVVDTASGTAA